jgi:hypothetical protein
MDTGNPDRTSSSSIIETTSLGSKLAGTRRVAELIDSTLDAAHAPLNITTTQDVSRVKPLSKSGIPPIGIPVSPDDQDPVGSTEQTVGWLDPQQKLHNGVDGYLDIVGATDEGPMSLKIATLGFPDDNTGRNPFELRHETDLGSVVFLAPTEPSDASPATLGPQASNHTMAMFDARSVPMSAFSTYNATDSHATVAIDPITVRLKADVSVRKSAVRENLCVTYNDGYRQLPDEPPMRLQRCDDSYIPGAPSAARGSSETQLWQYDPVTQEIRPLLLELEAKAIPGATVDSSKLSGPVTIASSAVMVVETAPPISLETDTTMTGPVVVAGASIESTPTSAVKAGMPSHSMVRRDGDDKLTINKKKSKSVTTKTPKPDSAVRNQGVVAPSFIAIPIAEPYNLIFIPKSTVGGTSIKKPKPPA